MKKDQFKT